MKGARIRKAPHGYTAALRAQNTGTLPNEGPGFFCSAARHALGLPFTAPQKTALSNGDNLPALLYCPKAAKLCGRIGKEHGRPLFFAEQGQSREAGKQIFPKPHFCIYAQYIIIIFRQTAAFLSLFLPFHRR